MLKLATQTLTLDRIIIKGNIIRLTRGLEIIIEHDVNMLILSNEEFGLLVSSPTLDGGISGISEELDALFLVYVDESPEKLTKDALTLRKNLLSLVPEGANT